MPFNNLNPLLEKEYQSISIIPLYNIRNPADTTFRTSHPLSIYWNNLTNSLYALPLIAHWTNRLRYLLTWMWKFCFKIMISKNNNSSQFTVKWLNVSSNVSCWIHILHCTHMIWLCKLHKKKTILLKLHDCMGNHRFWERRIIEHTHITSMH